MVKIGLTRVPYLVSYLPQYSSFAIYVFYQHSDLMIIVGKSVSKNVWKYRLNVQTSAAACSEEISNLVVTQSISRLAITKMQKKSDYDVLSSSLQSNCFPRYMMSYWKTGKYISNILTKGFNLSIFSYLINSFIWLLYSPRQLHFSRVYYFFFSCANLQSSQWFSGRYY